MEEEMIKKHQSDKIKKILMFLLWLHFAAIDDYMDNKNTNKWTQVVEEKHTGVKRLSLIKIQLTLNIFKIHMSKIQL